MFVRLSAIIILLFAGQFGSESQGSYQLGVLEDAQVPVRPLFQSDGTDWRPITPDCPDNDCFQPKPKHAAQITWTLSPNGNAPGQTLAGSKRPDSEPYASLENPGPLGTAKPQIATLMVTGQRPAPVLRPILASSHGFVSDPDRWTVSEVSPEVLVAVRSEFRKSYPTVSVCGSAPLTAKPYTDDSIKLVRTYASKYYWHVVETSVDACASYDDREVPLRSQWFLVNGANQAEYIGADFWLVGAGDYDNDGSSEVVFMVTRDHRTRYELFYDDFRGHVTFQYDQQ
jgi:hypothetical protein